MCSDGAVTLRLRWPPPHVVAALAPCEIQQRKVSPILPSSTHTPCYRFALLLLPIKALSAPATSVRRPNPMMCPRAPPSRRGAHRPHHQCPQLLLRAPIASSPPPLFLHEFIDNRPLRASPGPISASVSTTRPRVLRHPLQLHFHLLLQPLIGAPLRPTAIAITSQAPVSSLPV
jgi:hypothetical protein